MIEVRNLQKSFGAKTAVDGVSFKVEMGEVLGSLGPNGAGKPTSKVIEETTDQWAFLVKNLQMKIPF